MQFKDVAGLADVKSRLIKSHRDNRVPHAQMFLASTGGGGLPLAFAFAQFLFCENPTDDDSCGACPACRKVSGLVYPDLHLSFPTVSIPGADKPSVSDDFVKWWRADVLSNPYLGVSEWLQHATAEVSDAKQTKQGNITARECREIIRKLNYKTFEAPIKVLVIWLAEHLRESGNILLKLLEEPPEGTYIILVAHDQNQILPTILSRTQLVRLNPLTDEDVTAYLVSKLAQPERKAMDIARIADGNLTSAISMIGDAEHKHAQLFKLWMRGCFRHDPATLVPWVERFAELPREEQKTLLAYGLHYFRESLIIPHLGTDRLRLFDEEREGAAYLARELGTRQFELIAGRLDEAMFHLERNANPKILMLDVSLNVAAILAGTYVGEEQPVLS